MYVRLCLCVGKQASTLVSNFVLSLCVLDFTCASMCVGVSVLMRTQTDIRGAKCGVKVAREETQR